MMRAYFRPWRRKIGVVTLVMACVFTAGWVRSKSIVDQLCFRVISEETIQSVNGSVRWWSARNSTDRNSTTELWLTKPVDDWQSREGVELDWISDWLGIGFVSEEGVTLRIFQYPSIVIPLTMLSAYLLLGKQRVEKPAAVIEK